MCANTLNKRLKRIQTNLQHMTSDLTSNMQEDSRLNVASLIIEREALSDH